MPANQLASTLAPGPAPISASSAVPAKWQWPVWGAAEPRGSPAGKIDLLKNAVMKIPLVDVSELGADDSFRLFLLVPQVTMER